MKTSLVLINQHGLEKVPYLHYIYNAIIEAYAARGNTKVLSFADVSYQKIAAEGNSTALLVIKVPEGASIKKNLWEKINYPALVRQLAPENIFYLGEALPVLKETKGAVQWQFVWDLSSMILPDGAKEALIKKARKKTEKLLWSDKIVSYSNTAVDSLKSVLPLAAHEKLISWVPAPDKSLLNPALYTDELLETFKNQHTDGEAFFMLDARSAGEAEVIEYLKAFSHFKKWQRSSMRLGLLLSGAVAQDVDFQEKLDAYYYKKDVHVLTGLDKATLYGWLKSAYAVITPGLSDQGLDLQLATAGLGSLIVAPATPAAASLLPGAVFDLPAVDKTSLGQVLISCYKSEVLRSRHIRAGQEASENWQDARPVF
ncbi:hypothetical protein SAMN05192529_13315 [Arachidicoccus rhizosphaerae]|uniref:Glycosyl transferases group 1 n=1 Tax=Arachidicoccus rhizosphaerae TaxID=551991 RepID=A0A1H4CME2_9BACT|nr:hypothetical protein [Arachidicoccus rhizosphaerae]SEA61222.1 hypothetical protein SAMN05192529_13315 [Arachidicoccus rhizosphaerae]